MKNHFLLIFLVIAPIFLSAQADRRVLVEQATNASCGPCAGQNPAFDALLQQNSSIVSVIKYHSSWPGFDPMYEHNTSDNSARIGFYNINSVPRAVVGGIFNGAPNQVTQSMLNSYASNPSPFEELDIYHYLSPNEDTIFVLTRIQAAQDFNESGIRAITAIVEKHISFPSPPGTNGEKDFYDVMKKMLPSANGTPLTSSWTDGAYKIIAQSWKLENVYDKEQLGVVGFIQNMNSKNVHQSGVSSNEPFAPLFDHDISPLSLQGMTANNCSGSITPELSFINYGANDITSVDIHYSVNNEPVQVTPWSGSVGYLESKTITLPEITFDVQDENQLMVYFSNTNGVGDDYPANDTVWYSFDRAIAVTDDVNLTLKLDDAPEDITWNITNSANEIVFEGGPYSEPGAFISETLTFDQADCYQFSIYDAAGDGLTIPGFFNLYKGTEQIIGGSAFGSSATQQFSVDISVGIPELSFDPQIEVYPNPMTHSGAISFILPVNSQVAIGLLNQLGQKVATIADEQFNAGHHNLSIATKNLPQGIYFLGIQIGNEKIVRKIAITN
jgi:hypothetical protein